MAKLNCWELKKCGRETGGIKAKELGVCPATESSRANGINGGKSGGRACWAIAGTFCGGNIQGNFAQKINNCQNCEFYELVIAEEMPNYTGTIQILNKIR
jgi:hypothetical protein